MQRFRHRSAPAAGLMLVALVLGGGLIATHHHDDGLMDGELDAVALGCGPDRPDSATPFVATHVDSVTSHEVELCPACVSGQRHGVLAASQPTSRSLVTVTQDVRAADDLAIAGSDVLPPSPRGPPTV